MLCWSSPYLSYTVSMQFFDHSCVNEITNLNSIKTHIMSYLVDSWHTVNLVLADLLYLTCYHWFPHYWDKLPHYYDWWVWQAEAVSEKFFGWLPTLKFKMSLCLSPMKEFPLIWLWIFEKGAAKATDNKTDVLLVLSCTGIQIYAKSSRDMSPISRRNCCNLHY